MLAGFLVVGIAWVDLVTGRAARSVVITSGVVDVAWRWLGVPGNWRGCRGRSSYTGSRS